MAIIRVAKRTSAYVDVRSADLFLALFVLAAPVIHAGAQLEAAGATVKAAHVAGQWTVAIALLNRGDATAGEVQVTAVAAGDPSVTAELPVRIGEIPPGEIRTATLQMTGGGSPEQMFPLNVKGSWREGLRLQRFALRYVPSPRRSDFARGPAAPPGFAAANSGPGRAVPAGPRQAAPKGPETSTGVAESDLAPIRLHGLWGYAHSGNSSRIAIQPRFTQALPFSEGLAAVAVAGVWGYIDTTGAFRIPAQFHEAAPFSGGVAKVSAGDPKQIRYIDSAGNYVPGPPR